MTLEKLNKNNLHHAYLIEGEREEIVPLVLDFVQSLNVATLANPDLCQIVVDTFKIDDARQLKTLSSSKTFTNGKKIFIIYANNFLLEAQNSLLKLFEEPNENSHFFVITPSASSMLSTLISRFYFIGTENRAAEITKEAEKFINMSLASRIEFLKELLVEADETDEEGNEIISINSSRAKANKFLSALEQTLHRRAVSKTAFDTGVFEQIFKVREYLRQPGSSAKTLMESVALTIPVLQ